MKKILKISGYFFLGVVVILLLGTLTLSFTGFPRPNEFEVRNIKKAGFGQITDIMALMSSQPVFYQVVRSENKHVYFTKNGQPLVLDLDSKEIIPGEFSIPGGGLFSKPQYHNGTYYFLQENRDNEERILMSIKESSGEKDTLLVGNKGFYDFKLSPDGSEIVAVDQVNSTGVNNIYLVSTKTGDAEKILSSEEVMAIQEFGPENSFILVNEIKVGGEVTYFKLDLEDPSLIPYESKRDSISNYLSNTSRVITNTQAFSKDFGTSYFIRTGTKGLAGEFNTLFEMQGDSVKQISPEMAADVAHLELSPDDRFVVFTANAGGFGKIFAYDRRSTTIKTIYDDEEFNLDWFKNIPFVITDDNQILYTVSNFAGAKLLQADLSTAKSEIIDAVIDKSLNEALQFRKLNYPTTDDSIGIMPGINAYLYKPTSSEFQKLPVVIDLHGGPSMPAFPYQFPLAPYLVKKGIAVISPDYRGSSGYGISFETADNVLKRPKQIEDIKALKDWIKTQPDLDEERVMLMGASHGGYMVMASLAQYPGEFSGGISIAGVSDFSLVKHENNYHAQGYKYEFGDFTDPEIRPSIDSISPLTQANRITEPLMLLHGTADPRVVYQNSSRMADAIEAAGGRVHYLQANGYGHDVGARGAMDGMYMLAITMDFVEELLLDK